MTRETLEVATPRGTMPVHVHRPAEAAPAPPVILFMDAPGVRPALHGHAERLARAGYTALLPDLYYAIDPDERPRPERLAAGDAAEFGRMASVVGRMRDGDVLEETELLLDALSPEATAAVGCVGFCMGGRFGLRSAEALGDRLAAAALLHPSRLVTDDPDSPHLAVGRVTGELYFGFGENDHVTPLSVIPPLRERLQANGVRYRIEVMAGADHGFTMPGMPAYDEAAAERAWTGTLELLRARLPQRL